MGVALWSHTYTFTTKDLSSVEVQGYIGWHENLMCLLGSANIALLIFICCTWCFCRIGYNWKLKRLQLKPDVGRAEKREQREACASTIMWTSLMIGKFNMQGESVLISDVQKFLSAVSNCRWFLACFCIHRWQICSKNIREKLKAYWRTFDSSAENFVFKCSS